jgi:beta-barrel assembly-enhancing protease
MQKVISIVGLAGMLIMLCGTGPVWSAERARVRISSILAHTYTPEDVEAEIYFGRHLAARMLGNYSLWDNPRANRYINLVGRALCLYAGRSDLNFAFAVLDTDAVNAFATPGGYIFITRGAFQHMQNEAQLATVLSHEIAHVLRRHMVRELDIRAREGSAFGGITALIGGATGSFRSSLENSLEQAHRILFERGYPIADELEADKVGMQIAASAGYDPSALKTFLKRVGRFETEHRNDSREHPVLQQRLAAIEQDMTTLGLKEFKGIHNKERFYEMASSH